MSSSMRILIVADTKDYTNKLLLCDIRKRMKGFVRLGHDVQLFSPNVAYTQVGRIRSSRWARRLYKSYVEKLLIQQIKNYSPDIVYIGFAKHIDLDTIKHIRNASPNSYLMGYDVDIYPELQKNRIQTATGLDVLLTTYSHPATDPYIKSGVKCVFMPNICDPDIEYRYSIGTAWESEILFAGKISHNKYPTDDIRPKLLNKLLDYNKFRCHGSLGKPFIGGIDYYYAISGAKVGLSINADNNISLYHSDRITHFLACGTFVIAKYVPESEKLFHDRVHLRYFNFYDEFFEMLDWYLEHDKERKEIAEKGMQWCHQEFNCDKIAKYTLDVIEQGSYKAPWNS